MIKKEGNTICYIDNDNNMKNKNIVLEELCALLGKYTCLNREQINTDIPFLELGVDSIVLVRMSREIMKTYGIKITIRTLYEKLNNVNALAKFISENATDEPAIQCNLEEKNSTKTDSNISKDNEPHTKSPDYKRLEPAVSWQTTKVETKLRAYSPSQQQHVDDLIRRYNRKTQRSKYQTQKYRAYVADSKATVGFRMSIKELLYPIVAKKTEGSRIWDIDDNEYIDITMGFGTHIFGYRPKFVIDTLQKYINEGTQLGPRSPMLGETAELICEITGGERVAFTNTGTEANMSVMRIIRAVTGKSKIVIFRNSYHGHSDYALAEGQFQLSDGTLAGVTPGIPDSVMGEVMVLDYEDPAALDEIAKHHHELAGVFVEPVQGKNLSLQPAEFLHSLRKLTLELDIPLVFDEMITGFRCHIGGAQSYFGIQADIATYGKAIGGGLSIGIIVGKAKYLDAIDGGFWNYGDQSYPQTDRTFFVGTYCQHPMVIPVINTILRHMKEQGNQLQKELNRKTDRLTNTLNAYFDENKIPIHVAHFASVFRFEMKGNLDIFYFHMIERGVYIWELRMCFLSAAHTDKDVDYIIQAAKESAEDLRRGGFLPSDVPVPSDLVYKPCEEIQALNEEQKQLCMITNFGRNEKASTAYNVIISLKIDGDLYYNVLKNALQKVSDRYETLRSTIDMKNIALRIHKSTAIELKEIDFSSCDEAIKEETVNNWIKEYNKQKFNLSSEPAFEACVLKLSMKEHILVLKTHHIYVDGIALMIILEELAEIYSAGCEIRIPNLLKSVNTLPYDELEEESKRENLNYWDKKYSTNVKTCTPAYDYPRPEKRIHQGADRQVIFDESFCERISSLASQNNVSIYMVLLSLFSSFLSRITENDDIAISIPTTGRNIPGSERLVGHYAAILPFRTNVNTDDTVEELMNKISYEFMEALEHQDYSFAELCGKVRESWPELVSPEKYPISPVLFNYDNMGAMPNFSDAKATIYTSHVVHYIDKDMYINFISDQDRLILDCQYSTELYSDETMNWFIQSLMEFMSDSINDPHKRIKDLRILPRRKEL